MLTTHKYRGGGRGHPSEGASRRGKSRGEEQGRALEVLPPPRAACTAAPTPILQTRVACGRRWATAAFFLS
eukprot:scaffold1938_cov113-Isochrysis_galbana.AAC.1